jgi:deazaflavin-dependent oxidoreductase (nitroreductase family)
VKGSQLAVKVALSPGGAAFDRFCVRHLGHSPVSWVFARSEGVAYNRPLLLVTVGRRTGRERAVVLPHFRAGEGRVAVVGSRGGMPTDPYWARNLRAYPEARVIADRREHRVRVRLAQGEERARLWREIVARAPVYALYQERAKAHREIPVFVLERTDGGPLEAP